MITLGIDSSTDRLGAGLSDGRRVIGEDLVTTDREHASQIIGLIDAVLIDCDIDKKDLQAIAVGIGPGSFTGLRVGLAVAKGLVLALNIPLIGISTFDVIARRLRSKSPDFYLASPVRRGEFYLGHTTAENNPGAAIEIVAESELVLRIGEKPLGFIGRRPQSLGDEIPSEINPAELYISGGELALLGAERLESGESDNPADLEPYYIAPSQAELKFAERKNKNS